MPFPYSWRTENFVLHYGYRSAYEAHQDPGGYREPLLPLDGVRQLSYVVMFGSFFERAWSAYERLGLSLPTPPFHIYLQHLNTPLDGVTLPPPDVRIAVRSRFDPPWNLGNISAMQATAAHEFFHAIEMGYRAPVPPPAADPWQWWSEATATFMEDIVFPGTIDYLKFLNTWLDEPSVPLDSLEGLSSQGTYPAEPPPHHFGGALFCRFLQRHFDLDLILETWRQASRHRLPFEAIQSILDSGRYGVQPPLASSQERDLFGSEFLPTNFFLSDLPRYGYEGGNLYEHFFQHVFVSRILEVPTSKPHHGTLDHLSAEYFLMRPPQSSMNRDLTITLKCDMTKSILPPSESPLKGVLIPIKMRRSANQGTDIRLEPIGGGQFERRYTDANFWQDGIDEALLIVVNTTWGDDTWELVPYELSVT
jgi:hypothetical protein